MQDNYPFSESIAMPEQSILPFSNVCFASEILSHYFALQRLRIPIARLQPGG